MNTEPKINELEKKINTIDEMISFAKQKFVTQDATTMILTGWMFFGIYLVWGINDYFISTNNRSFSAMGNLALMILALLPLLYVLKNKKRLEEIKKRNSYATYIQKSITLGMVISFFVIIIGMWMLQNDIKLSPYFTVVFLASLGTSNFITSRLAHYKWVSWFSIPIWVMALLAAYFGRYNYTLVNWNFLGAFAILIGSALPGHIIKFKTRHEKPQTP